MEIKIQTLEHEQGISAILVSLPGSHSGVNSETRNMNDLEGRIKAWLEKQGYPFEMRVAREFKRAGFMVETSTYYKDAEGSKFREIDIVASRVGWADKDRKIFFDIHYTCE
jgi:hypothetical protein